MQTESNWYLAYTKLHHEKIVERHLLNQKFKVYVPFIKVFKNKDRKDIYPKYEPMFPRYIFFQPLDSTHSISPVRSTIGITNLVKFGNAMATIKFKTMQKIQMIEQEQHKGCFQEITGLKPGNKIIFTRGAFDGLEAVISHASEKRVTVLMQLLGQDTRIVFNTAELMAAM